MTKPRILVFAGSARENSLNKKLARIAAKCVGDAGAEVTFVDLRDFPIPLYDGDLELREGMPPFAVKLREMFIAHQGLLIASPENNGCVTALLKNTIDWLSREYQGRSGLEPYKGKVAAIMGASPGNFGAVLSLQQLRPILCKLTVTVLADQVMVAKADQAFKEDGSFVEDRNLKAVTAVARRLVEMTAKLNT